jgi:hypothetical protein
VGGWVGGVGGQAGRLAGIGSASHVRDPIRPLLRRLACTLPTRTFRAPDGTLVRATAE